MPLDWTQPLQTSHDKARRAHLMDGCGPGGQRRVAIIGDYALSHNIDWETVFLFDETGRCNTSGNDSPFDLVNAA